MGTHTSGWPQTQPVSRLPTPQRRITPDQARDESIFSISSFSLYYCAENYVKPFDVTDSKVPWSCRALRVWCNMQPFCWLWKTKSQAFPLWGCRTCCSLQPAGRNSINGGKEESFAQDWQCLLCGSSEPCSRAGGRRGLTAGGRAGWQIPQKTRPTPTSLPAGEVLLPGLRVWKQPQPSPVFASFAEDWVRAGFPLTCPSEQLHWITRVSQQEASLGDGNRAQGGTAQTARLGE